MLENMKADRIVSKQLESFKLTPAAHRARIFNVQSIIDVGVDVLKITEVGGGLQHIENHRQTLEEFVSYQKAFMKSDHENKFIMFEPLRENVEYLLKLAEASRPTKFEKLFLKNKISMFIYFSFVFTMIYLCFK